MLLTLNLNKGEVIMKFFDNAYENTKKYAGATYNNAKKYVSGIKFNLDEVAPTLSSAGTWIGLGAGYLVQELTGYTFLALTLAVVTAKTVDGPAPEIMPMAPKR